MKKAVLTTLYLATFISLFAEDLFIDLTTCPLYIRQGFDVSELNKVPDAEDPLWIVYPPSDSGSRSVRLMDLEFDSIPQRKPFSFSTDGDMEFTFHIPFEFDSRHIYSLVSGEVPGVYLASIGDNWQIFLNGTLIDEAFHIDSQGRIRTPYNRKVHYFPFNPSLIIPGTNNLVIRIMGDPAYPPLGLDSAGPYYIAEYTSIEKKASDKWALIFIGLYLFIGIYHIFIFLVRRQDRYNLFYGLFSADLAIYLFVRTQTVYDFLANRRLIFNIELSSLFLIIPFIGAFLDLLRSNRFMKITKIYSLFCIILIAGVIATPLSFAYDILSVWQISALFMAVYYVFYRIIVCFFVECHRRWKRQEENDMSLVRTFLKGIKNTALGNLLFGGFIIFFTAVFDIVDSAFFHTDTLMTKYGFFIFTMSTALILANRFNFLHSRVNELNLSLEDRVNDLQATTQLLAINEKKYRSLFNGTSDPVALLTEDLVFIEGNRAAMSLFGLDRPGNTDLSLKDILYGQDLEKSQGRVTLDRVLRAMIKDNTPEEAQLRIRTPIGEPKNCRLRLEFITSMNQKEILMRVLPEEKDPLLESFIEAREVYTIDNTLSSADEASRRMTRNLSKYADTEDANYLMICLREIIINAIEHGNLEIGYEDKTQALREERYFEFVQERQKEDPYRNRKVTIEYSITAQRAIFRITDMGPGFDHREFISHGNADEQELLEHGRGMFMTLNAFDTVRYNDKGNQVILIKNFV